MINGPRRSRIGPKLTEIEASKVGKTRKTPGFPGHRYLGDAATPRTVDHVLLETRLFEPLTWLEAAIFFAFASVQLPAKRDEMRALAADRWRAYEAVAGDPFDANVARLARHAR